jgi:uncharacterized protein (TIGR03000 family)
VLGPPPPSTPAPATGDNEGRNNDKPDPTGKLDGAAQARLIVRLPEGARLYVDGQLIRDAADQKELPTPRLEMGKEYCYEVRAEVVRDGQRLTQTRQVTLSAGETIRTDFSGLGRGSGVATRER